MRSAVGIPVPQGREDVNDALVALLAVLAVAFPFVFAFTEPPLAAFWPWMASAACALVLCCLALTQSVRGGADATLRERWAAQLALGVLLAALLGSGIGLAQYFLGDPGLQPFVYPTERGQAPGNLRQRNQQASLMAIGAWVLLWITLQVRGAGGHGSGVRAALLSGGRAWSPAVGGGLLAGAGIALALAGAATASRTGALQWILVMGLVALWHGRKAPGVLALAAAGLVLYGLAAWALPDVLRAFTGVRAEGLFERVLDEPQACTGRMTLWSNMLELIALKPWTGWGWGQLAYAHYITPFEGLRFCVLLDNAHNLPLHLAVELGLPLAGLVCGVVLLAVLKARPWREHDPVRQLAWGLLAIIGVHSLLEFPLWYGPFQILAAISVGLLWRRTLQISRLTALGAGVVWSLAVALWWAAAVDFHRVSQLYKPEHERSADLRTDTHAKVSGSWFFANAVDFALLTTLRVTPESAAAMRLLAVDLVHYSPEPRVVERLVDSARLLGDEATAALHEDRYRRAYPAEHALWQARQRSSGPASAAQAGAVPGDGLRPQASSRNASTAAR